MSIAVTGSPKLRGVHCCDGVTLLAWRTATIGSLLEGCAVVSGSRNKDPNEIWSDLKHNWCGHIQTTIEGMPGNVM